MESIFSKVFSYRQKENRSPLENYLTEILAYALESDAVFRKDFVTLIFGVQIGPHDSFSLSTQKDYKKYGRPDIEFLLENRAILIECKVEADERHNQLSDYTQILLKEKATFNNKSIVFLTKYFEFREAKDNDVTLHLIRWFEIHKIINEKHSQLTQQLKLFLREQNMESIKNFNIQDLLALKTIPETISKMDELLEQFKPVFGKMFGGYSKDSSRSTRLPGRTYINYVTFQFDKIDYWLDIGFFWWWWDESREIPVVGICLEVPKKLQNSELIQVLDRELSKRSEWEIEESDQYYYHCVKPITDFISQDEDDIPQMNKFISVNLTTLYDIKNRYPKLLRKK